jgi:hypothetical protein
MSIFDRIRELFGRRPAGTDSTVAGGAVVAGTAADDSGRDADRQADSGNFGGGDFGGGGGDGGGGGGGGGNGGGG